MATLKEQLARWQSWRRTAGADVWLHSFLRSVADGSRRSTSRCVRFTPGKEPPVHGGQGNCVGPTADMDVSEKTTLNLPEFEFLYVEDDCSTFFRIVGNHSPDDTSLHPRTQESSDNHTYLLTYLLTPCCTVLLEKLTGLQLVKKFPAFHGTRRFITALTSARHCLYPGPAQSSPHTHIPPPGDPS